MKISHLCSAVIIITLALAGCKKTGNTNNGEQAEQMSSNAQMTEVNTSNSDFSANLAGSNEVPAIQSNGSGSVMFRVSSDSSKLYYTLSLSGIDSVMMAHIHYGTPSDNGSIAVWLFPNTGSRSPGMEAGPVNGVLKSGVIDKSALMGPMSGKTVVDLIHAIQHDSAYVNVHTAKHPEGEVRGQIQQKAAM